MGNRVSSKRPEGFDDPAEMDPAKLGAPAAVVEEAPPAPPTQPAPGRFRGLPPAAARLEPARRRYDRRTYGGRLAPQERPRDETAEAIERGDVTIDDIMNSASPRFDESFPNVVEAEYVDLGQSDVDRARCIANGEKYVTPQEAADLERKRGGANQDSEVYGKFLGDIRAAAAQSRRDAQPETAQVGRGLTPQDVAHGVRYQEAPAVGNFADEPDGPPEAHFPDRT